MERCLKKLILDADLTVLGELRHARGNTLLANRGDGSFTDVTDDSGATIAGWAWGATALDFNNDGLPDLYSPNGFLTNEKSEDL